MGLRWLHDSERYHINLMWRHMWRNFKRLWRFSLSAQDCHCSGVYDIDFHIIVNFHFINNEPGIMTNVLFLVSQCLVKVSVTSVGYLVENLRWVSTKKWAWPSSCLHEFVFVLCNVFPDFFILLYNFLMCTKTKYSTFSIYIVAFSRTYIEVLARVVMILQEAILYIVYGFCWFYFSII